MFSVLRRCCNSIKLITQGIYFGISEKYNFRSILTVLRLELLQAPQLAHAQPAVFLLPVVEGRLRDAKLAADLLNGSARVGLA